MASSSSSSVSRGVNWGDEETATLINIWGEEEIQGMLEGSIRNKKVWETISKRMKENDYEKSADACRIRIKNLKHTYKKTKDHNNKSGNGKKTSKYFELMDQILGTRPSTRPEVLVDTSISTQDDSLSEHSSGELETEEVDTCIRSSSPVPTPCSSQKRTPCQKAGKRTKEDRFQKAMEVSMNTFIEFQRVQERAMLALEEKRLKLEDEAEQRREERAENRRREEQQHAYQLFQLIASMGQQQSWSQPPTYHDM